MLAPLVAAENAAELWESLDLSRKRAVIKTLIGAPADIDAFNDKITHLEQQAVNLRIQLEERGEELAAARAANRELMAQLNTAARRQ